MLRRSFRFGLRLGLLAAALAIAMKALELRRSQLERFPPPRADDWPPIPAPPTGPVPGGTARPSPEGATTHGSGREPGPGPGPWVPPDGKACPATHPVKANMSSRIFHLPGMAAYERTRPDRCYLDAAAAKADGLRRAKR